MRITRVKQANKVHLLSTLNAQQLRSDGNRSHQELTANELHICLLGAHGSAVGSGDHEQRLRAAHEQGQAEARLSGAPCCRARPQHSELTVQHLTDSAAPAADSGPCELTAPLWQGHIHELTVQSDANQDTPTPDSAAALTLRSPVAAHQVHRADQPDLTAALLLSGPAAAPDCPPPRGGHGT